MKIKLIACYTGLENIETEFEIEDGTVIKFKDLFKRFFHNGKALKELNSKAKIMMNNHSLKSLPRVQVKFVTEDGCVIAEDNGPDSCF